MRKSPKLVTPGLPCPWLMVGGAADRLTQLSLDASAPGPGGSLSSSVVILTDLINTSGFLLRPQETQPLTKRMVSQD